MQTNNKPCATQQKLVMREPAIVGTSRGFNN